MCDQNGHMNVAYYLQAFDENSRDLFERIGFDKNYLQMGYSCFAVEDSLRYVSEFLEGDEIRSMFRIHDFNDKLIHIVGVLLDKDYKLSANSETLVVHVNMQHRKASHMPESLLKKVTEVHQHHTKHPVDDLDIRLKIRK
jgi:acyl-CoA thioester hydrolase